MPGAAPPLTADWGDVLMHHKSFIVLFVAAAVSTLLLTPLYIRMAVRCGWVDRPGGRKAHGRPTATMGGLVVFGAVFGGTLLGMAWNNRVGEMLREHMLHVLAALGCTAAAIIVGVVDDLRGMRPKIKLALQLIIAVAAYGLGFSMHELTLPGVGSVVLGGVSFVLSIAWIVGIMNAINFTDGLDGLAAGVCFLASAVNAGIAIWLGNYYMTVTMLLLAGALLGFLRWNFHPARVFLGDAGSLGLGTFLALCSLHSAQKAHTAVMILVPLCALGYPIFDMLLAMARRTARGQPWWSSDREHIHHRLQRRGHSASRTAFIIYAVSLVLVFAGVFAMTSNHLVVGAAVGLILLLAVFSIRVLGYIEWSGWDDRLETRVLHAAANLARLKMRQAVTPQAAVDALGVFAAEAGLRSLRLSREAACADWSRNNSDGSLLPSPVPPSATSEQRLELAEGWLLTVVAPTEALNDQNRMALLDDIARRIALDRQA